jgi:hypothetical protein
MKDQKRPRMEGKVVHQRYEGLKEVEDGGEGLSSGE